MLLCKRLPVACLLGFVILAGAQEQPQKPIGEIFASDASVKGAVQLAGSGMQVMSGSSVAAGQATALLRLTRGGDVRVCPRTSLSISSSHNGRDLMFGMNAGTVEAQYALSASADAILTPDFRILLAGPGSFHVAIGADARGNTCVRPLAGNAASVIVSELMGDGTYQVKPDEQVVFHNGKLADADRAVVECGCPAAPPVMRASEVPAIPSIGNLRKTPPSLNVPLEWPSPPPQSIPASAANDVHVEVDAPFVFSAVDPEPAPLAQVAQLRTTAAPPWTLAPPPPPEVRPVAEAPPAAPVAAQQAPPKKKFFGKIRAFFASIFR